VTHDADDTLARVLRDRVEPGPPAGPCLDADIVAAWFDGSLTVAEQRQAEAHASACARCQALLAAMAQTEPVAATSRRLVSVVRWVAPALVAAAAVLVWVNVARRSADVSPVHRDVVPGSAATPAVPARQAAAPAAKRLEEDDAQVAARKPASEPKAPSPKTLGTQADAARLEARRNEQGSGAAATAVSPEASRRAQLKDEAGNLPQRAAPIASSALAPIVRSPDGSLWRIARDGAIDRSNDDGATWREQDLGSSAHLIAGSSPSPNVVWFAGAAGAVVVTVDGVSWHWRSLPERVDVTGIAAVDGQTATATSRDGRRFVTHDGGLSWVPASLQENPAAPF
jgi:hypothetical protein